MKVGSLYDSTNCRWNEVLICEFATPNDVDQILKISLPTHSRPDQLIFPYTDNGRVSVKIAYHPLKEAEMMRVPDIEHNRNMPTTIWSVVWITNTIPKIKHFMWKLFTNSLPVMKNLRRRRMNVLPNCPVCGWEEDIEHMIYKCGWTEIVLMGSLGLGASQHDRKNVGDWI